MIGRIEIKTERERGKEKRRLPRTRRKGEVLKLARERPNVFTLQASKREHTGTTQRFQFRRTERHKNRRIEVCGPVKGKGKAKCLPGFRVKGVRTPNGVGKASKKTQREESGARTRPSGRLNS